MRNIFLGYSYTKRGGENVPRHFSKKSKLSMSKVLYSLFPFYAKLRTIEIYSN